MSVEVVLPWAGSCPHRARALEWVLGRYADRRPDWTVTVAQAPEREVWCKAAAVTPTIAGGTGDIVVVADADVWCDALPEAVQAVQDGAPWAVPHLHVHRLGTVGTAAVLAGEAWEAQPVGEPPYVGLAGGGILVAHREVILTIPLDSRFVGWG